MPTVLISGAISLIIAACWSSGARSDVPVTLVPVLPEKLSMPSATPYSVTEVPTIGISFVAETAA